MRTGTREHGSSAGSWDRGGCERAAGRRPPTEVLHRGRRKGTLRALFVRSAARRGSFVPVTGESPRGPAPDDRAPMIVAVEFDFDAAHNLPNYAGKCERLHGHTYRLQV